MLREQFMTKKREGGGGGGKEEEEESKRKHTGMATQTRDKRGVIAFAALRASLPHCSKNPGALGLVLMARHCVCVCVPA